MFLGETFLLLQCYSNDMNEEHFAKGNNAYVYPNQHLPYFRDVADIFEEEGLDYEDSEVLFVGGTMYAHDFKADHSEAKVDVIERNPLTAYLQTFVSHQFKQGYDREEVRAHLFDYNTRVEREDIPANPVVGTWSGWPELDTIGVDDEELKENVQQHQNFSDSEWWTHSYGFADDILYSSKFDPEEPEFSFHDKLMSKLGRKDLDRARKRRELDEFERHSEEHEEDVLWAHVREGVPEDEPDRLTLEQAGAARYNWREVLEDVESFAPVDKIRIEDVRESEGNYDAIFFNNVFDYIDLGRTNDIINSLADEDVAYLEATLLGWSIPNEGRVSFDDRMPENIELMEYAPEADFYWKRWPEDQKGIKESPNKVRLYQPTE